MRRALAALFACLMAGAAPAQNAASREPPELARDVGDRRLPAMQDRLPREPRVTSVTELGGRPGRYGGTLRLLMGDQRDVRMVTIYSYVRLVVFDRSGDIVPDILRDVAVEDGRIFTLTLREGHRWSDGAPFTTEDFRYWWEDVAQTERLTPGGLPSALLVDGEKPTFEILSPTVLRYAWSRPNPAFLPALAGAQPVPIFMPAHYMKQFHVQYADPGRLGALVRQARVKDWGALHDRKARAYRLENPDLPTLAPWRPVTTPPAELFVFERNPFFHRVDEAGLQLPYIGRMTIAVGTSSLIPAKVAAGGADLAARYLRFDNYPFLKAGEATQNYRVLLWENGVGSALTLIPNLNVADPLWRGLFRDKRVRQALSVAIDRREINQVIYFGLAHEGANTLIPASPLYREAYDTAWAQRDPALANRLLDEAGLQRRDRDGVRLLPDGRRAEITIQTAGDNTEESDVLELIGHHWREVGVALFVRPLQRDILRRSVIAGRVMMSTWPGLDNALASPDMDPGDLAPSNSMQFQWPLWGQYVDTAGRAGEKPDLRAAQELAELHRQWRRSSTTDERRAIWRRMLEIHAEEVFTIGTVNRTLQPVVASNKLRNIPAQGVYSFTPGAYFGRYHPDLFWFDQDGED